MMVNEGIERALDRIAARSEDVRRVFRPEGADFDPSASLDARTPLSAHAPDGAYFVTRDRDGRARYLRDGHFSLRDGKLVDASGAAVLGFAGEHDAALPLRIDPVDAALGRVRDARLASDGTISYDNELIDPRSGSLQRGRVIVGRVALARFPAATRMTPSSHGSTPPVGVAPYVGRPGDGNFAALTPMRDEGSWSEFDRNLNRLEEAYLSFDALEAAHQAQLDARKSAMDTVK